MRASYLIFLIIFMNVSAIAIHASAAQQSAPLLPDASALHEILTTSTTITTSNGTLDVVPLLETRATPVRVTIPSIDLDAPIEHLGLNEKGEMAVPDGQTNNVGWYKYGTIPGERGSAVLDAHVYAAFENLHRAAVGDDIYIGMSDGSTHHFIASERVVHRLEDVSPDTLFNRTDTARLNLITCAGSFDHTRDTYDHRLIVYAQLVSE